MRTVIRLAAALAWLVEVIGAQDTRGFEPLPNADAIAVGVLWAHGYDDDPPERCGLARVLAESRLLRASAAVPEASMHGVRVGGDFALAFAVVDAGERDRAVAFLRALLDDRPAAHGSAALTDDALELLIARAALFADDAEFVFPGDVLATCARRAHCAGTRCARPPAGSAQAIAALTSADVRARLQDRVGVRIAAIGAVDEALIERLRAVPQRAEAAPRTVATCAGEVARRAPDFGIAQRADAPFVAASVAAPPAAQRTAFALGLEVARARCYRRFRLRGNEGFAGAPFVRWSWLEAEPVAVFYRRGEQPRRLLPGQSAEATAADEVRAIRAELEALFADLRQRAPTAEELALARHALRAQFALAAIGADAGPTAQALPGRLVALLLAGYHGMRVEETHTVTAAAVHALVRDRLREDRIAWHVLMPVERPDVGYRRR